MISKQASRSGPATLKAQSSAWLVAFAAALLMGNCKRSAPTLTSPVSTQPAPAPAAEHGPFQLAAACRGSCSVDLAPLSNDRALVLWGDHDGTWGQRFDLASGRSLGAPQTLGKLNEKDPPYVFASSEGDAALFGALSDGRVTFARGSEAAARRVAPKVVAGAAQGVRSLAAAATAEGLALLILRGLDAQGARAQKPLVDAELHWLDAHGEQVHPPLIWKTPYGAQARLASCGEQLYLAWTTAEGALLTRAAASGQAREQMLLPRWKANLDANLGPLRCTATGASLVSGWQNPSLALQRQVSVASISATEAVPQRGRWTNAALPGDPDSFLTNELPLAAYASPTGAQVLVDQDYFVAVAGFDTAAGKAAVLPNSAKLPRGTPCLPTSDGRRALCVASQVSKPVAECKQYVKTLTASFVGDASFAAPTPSSTAPAPEPYFASGGAPIPDSAPRAKGDAVDPRSQLRCGEPGWDGLRKAVVAFCAELAQKRDAAKKKSERQERADELNAYCGKDPSSLLFQASNCTDEPLTCPHSSVSDVLSVDRNEFEKGSDRLTMDVLHNCNVWFSGKGDSWRLVDHECNGD